MRKYALIVVFMLLSALVVGCGSEPSSIVVDDATPEPTEAPMAEPTSPPDPTEVSEPSEEEPTPSGPATCVVEPMDFPVVPGIPEVTEDDYVLGPEDASITVIEYADFQ